MAGRDGPSFRSLRGRFLFYFLVLSVLSLLLFGALFAGFVWREKNREEDRARNELVEQAQEIARDLELAFGLGQQFPDLPIANVERVTQLLRLDGQLINAATVVVDEGGGVVAPLPVPVRVPRSIDPDLLASGKIVTNRADVGIVGDAFVVAVPLDIPSQPTFYNLVLAKRYADLVATPSGGLFRYLVIAGGAALILSIALALYLSGYVLKPLRSLSQAAWELAHGNLDSRVEVKGRDEISELSRYFNYMAERIQTSTQLQKDFVANVSHEIRTPLTSIEGFSQALLEDIVESEEDKRRYLTIISDETARLKRVLEQLLALSRIDAGVWVLHPAKLSVAEYVTALGEKLLPQAREKGIALRVEADAGIQPIETDGDTLGQVLHNLLDNAIKFTPEGGEVVISANRLPMGARIQVKDNGQGIPAEELEHIFDRFARVERSRSQRYGGSGLGLAVCRELLNLLGGKISVWSQPGKGTVFTVELPLRPPDIPPTGGR
ncbi:MAG: sensor histidine kinase [Actinobacteria bacterium]|jgi:signal transduction histidine kinase|nr:MAG: sensor histidine kinase [Actinomycetota bacterium]